MRQFKLIKSYPNSENIGSIWQKTPELKNYWYMNSSLDPADVEDNPEFFEEIIEKGYEILSFKAGDCKKFTFTLKENSLYSCIDEMGSQTLDSLLKYNWKIHSIRRLSDNEVFSIGDKVDWKSHKNHSTISEIKLFNDVPVIVLTFKDDTDQLSSSLQSISKAKPVLFTTQDCVDIYEGDSVWGFYIGYGHVFEQKDLERAKEEQWLKFSSKEKAEEYVLMNKPVLSFQDVLNCTVYVQKILLEDELKALVKSRL